MSMENQNETVILEIEGTALKCNKELLINNSDYFRAMLTGNFRESTQETIKIQDVNLKSFNTILLLLWDDQYIIDYKELHSILQAACMLQFNSIKQLCETRLVETLKPSNCLAIWKITELLDISPLWLKAKAMALEEFTTICDSQISDLSLDEICEYLGNTYLNVKHEFAVFQSAMNWWYENQEHAPTKVNVILRLLNCIDFKTIRENEIKEMQTYPDIADNAEIMGILNCLVALRANDKVEEFPERRLNLAKHFLNCQNRQKPVMPCLLMEGEAVHVNSLIEKNIVVTDKYLRKRIVHKVSDHPQDNYYSFLTYDTVLKDFKTIVQIDMDKLRNLIGYKLMSYKEFVLLYGGEYLIGVGNWNFNFWTYDTLKGKWERKSKLPQGRRHFESTVVDNCIYLIGGVGRYRVVQENMIWYDFIADKWSSVIPLPSNDRYFRCCSFNGKLCIFYLCEKRAYIYNKEITTWMQIEIQVDKEFIGDFTVFSDENYLYIKGSCFIRLKLENNKLVPTKQIDTNPIVFLDVVTVLCNGTVYSLYRCVDNYHLKFTFESFNLKTETVEYIFRERRTEEPLKVDNLPFYLTGDHILFSVNYYSLVKDNIFINNENVFLNILQ